MSVRRTTQHFHLWDLILASRLLGYCPLLSTPLPLANGIPSLVPLHPPPSLWSSAWDSIPIGLVNDRDSSGTEDLFTRTHILCLLLSPFLELSFQLPHLYRLVRNIPVPSSCPGSSILTSAPFGVSVLQPPQCSAFNPRSFAFQLLSSIISLPVATTFPSNRVTITSVPQPVGIVYHHLILPGHLSASLLDTYYLLA